VAALDAASRCPHRCAADKRYVQAQQLYTKAIEADPTSAVLWGNRAFAAIRLEEFGGAIADATKALELDDRYAKGYYRRGDASFALGHFKDAVRDFRAAIRLAPSDPDLRRKVRFFNAPGVSAVFWVATSGATRSKGSSRER
jgi:tetratricopeptide (TPR) repeat protein